MGIALITLIVVLLIEQVRPLSYRSMVERPLRGLADALEHRCNVGEGRYGLLGWLLAVGGLVAIALGVHWALFRLHPFIAWLWNVLVLYLAMGFRRESDYYADIQVALRMGDLAQARRLLSEWCDVAHGPLTATEVARLSIEAALATSHRRVFGVIACFALLPGPSGAVLYRVSAFLADSWGRRTDDDVALFGRFARQAFSVVDWLPQRLSAAAFAIVGNFEAALGHWRNNGRLWCRDDPDSGLRQILASGAGALGVRLDAVAEDEDQAADVDAMQSAVGLLWRALLLWLFVLLLLAVGGLIGG